MDEAKCRGFKVHITEDRYEKAEIGVYSQHICHPENAKFSIILLHDMCSCSVNAALAIVDDLLEQGYRFVTVSQLAQLRGTEPRPGLVYSRFR